MSGSVAYPDPGLRIQFFYPWIRDPANVFGYIHAIVSILHEFKNIFIFHVSFVPTYQAMTYFSQTSLRLVFLVPGCVEFRIRDPG